MKKLVLITTLVGALGAGGAALAQPWGGGGGEGCIHGAGPGGRGGDGFGPGAFLHGRFGRLLEDLNLNEKQEDLAFDIRREMMKSRRGMAQQHLGQLNELSAELAKPRPDAAKLKQLSDKFLEDQRVVAHNAIDKYLELHATLTDAQRKALVEKLGKAGNRAKRWLRE